MTDVKNDADPFKPNGIASSPYPIPKDNPDMTELHKQNDLALKDPGILDLIKTQYIQPTYQIFSTEAANTADTAKVQDTAYQTEFTHLPK